MYLIVGCCFGKCWRGIFATNYSPISNVVEGKRVHDAKIDRRFVYVVCGEGVVE
jgi:hypothetical protein